MSFISLKFSRPFLILLVFIFAFSLLTACAEPRTAAAPEVTSGVQTDGGQEEVAGTSTSVDLDKLQERARAEGGDLMLYTSINIDDLEPILAKFNQTYPFTHPDYYRASGDNVIQKAITEARTGQHFADVFETEAFEVYRLYEVGLLQPFIAPESAAYPIQARHPDGYWTVDRINTVVIGYNTELVDPEDVPTSWEDLLDPKWKGKMGVELNDIQLLSDMVNYWGEKRAYALWEGIANQQPGFIDGHTELAQLLSAGEFEISPNLYAHRVERLKAEGAPIEWVKTDPVFAYTQLLAMAADAPHPATASLFINWLLSEEGQISFRDVGRIPARPGITPDPPNLVVGLNLVFTVPDSAANYNVYAEKWREILKLE